MQQLHHKTACSNKAESSTAELETDLHWLFQKYSMFSTLSYTSVLHYFFLGKNIQLLNTTQQIVQIKMAAILTTCAIMPVTALFTYILLQNVIMI